MIVLAGACMLDGVTKTTAPHASAASNKHAWVECLCEGDVHVTGQCAHDACRRRHTRPPSGASAAGARPSLRCGLHHMEWNAHYCMRV